jgi:hypothetical protein
MLKRNILQVVVLVVALSAYGQASAGDTERGSSTSDENLGSKSVLANKRNTNRALKGGMGMGMGKGKGKGKGGSKGSKGKGKGKGKVS